MPNGVTRDTASAADREMARLDYLFVEALRDAATPRRHGQRGESAMSVALAEACRLSRARGLQPEQVIIMLKTTWGRVRDTSYATLDEAHEALDRAVSACIHQYFAEYDASTDDSGSGRQ